MSESWPNISNSAHSEFWQYIHVKSRITRGIVFFYNSNSRALSCNLNLQQLPKCESFPTSALHGFPRYNGFNYNLLTRTANERIVRRSNLREVSFIVVLGIPRQSADHWARAALAFPRAAFQNCPPVLLCLFPCHKRTMPMTETEHWRGMFLNVTPPAPP